MRVILFGASGLVGSHLLPKLLNHKEVSRVTLVGRHNLAVSHPKLTQVLISFDQLDNLNPDTLARLGNQDMFISCLGTTIKKAKSKANFKRVDYDFVLHAAQLGHQLGASRAIIVSALGANPKAPVFYNQVKGQMEEAVAQLPFDSIEFIRPSLLMGKRNESRFGEDFSKPLMQALAPFLIGKLQKYRAIHAEEVANSIINGLKRTNKGRNIIFPSV